METTELVPSTTLSLASLYPNEEICRALAEKYAGLKISGIDDKDGYKKCHDARMELVKARTTITKNGKALREDANAFIKTVIRREKELIEIISPTEEALYDEETRIDNEKARIKREAQAKEEEKITARINELVKYGYTPNTFDIRTWSDEKYAETLVEKKEAFEKAEEERKVREEAERLEREKYEREKAEFEAKQREIEERERVIREKEEAIERERQEKEREERRRVEIEQAEERSRRDTEARLRREAEEKARKEREEMEKIEKRRKYKAWLEENGCAGE